MDLLDNIRGMGDDHAVLSNGIDRLVTRVMNGFRVLQRRQFAAPWPAARRG